MAASARVSRGRFASGTGSSPSSSRTLPCMSARRGAERIFSFFFNDTATTEIYTSFPTRRSSDLYLREEIRAQANEALGREVIHKIEVGIGPKRTETGPARSGEASATPASKVAPDRPRADDPDRKSTRLNSSHGYISYAVFCLKKK